MNPDQVRRLIEAGLPGADVQVAGDGRHFEADVVSAGFEGKSVVAQHRMVFAALGEHFDGEMLHALVLRTYTPAQWQSLRA